MSFDDLTVEKLKGANENGYEGAMRDVTTALDKSADPTERGFRVCQGEITKLVGGASHPAVKMVDDEIKRGIELVRDARDEADDIFAMKKFTFAVEVHTKNAKASIAAGVRCMDSESFNGYIDGYWGGEEYKFAGGRGHYRPCDLNRVALGELSMRNIFLYF